MSAAGSVEVRLDWSDGQVRSIQLRLHRPDATRVLRGLAADQAIAVLPRLYSVCGCAQQVAAQRALEQARGVQVAAEVEAERDARISHECAQEHLWRLLIDWPKLLSLPPAERAFVAWHRRLTTAPDDSHEVAQAAARFVRDELLGLPAQQWEALDGAGLDGWLAEGRGLAAMLLASLPAEAAVQDKTETSALARQCDRPAVRWALRRGGWSSFARVLARIVELADCLMQINSGPMPPSKNASLEVTERVTRCGRAAVETARGRLEHEVELDGEGRVRSYRVVAPTDVNFRNDGPCARSLAVLQAPSAEAAVSRARQVVLGFDPCVPSQVSARA